MTVWWTVHAKRISICQSIERGHVHCTCGRCCCSSSSSLDFWRIKLRYCAYYSFAPVHVICAQCTQKVGRTIGFVVSALLANSTLHRESYLQLSLSQKTPPVVSRNLEQLVASFYICVYMLIYICDQKWQPFCVLLLENLLRTPSTAVLYVAELVCYSWWVVAQTLFLCLPFMRTHTVSPRKPHRDPHQDPVPSLLGTSINNYHRQW